MDDLPLRERMLPPLGPERNGRSRLRLRVLGGLERRLLVRGWCFLVKALKGFHLLIDFRTAFFKEIANLSFGLELGQRHLLRASRCTGHIGDRHFPVIGNGHPQRDGLPLRLSCCSQSARLSPVAGAAG